MKDPWLWIGELLGAFLLFGLFYLIFWFAAIVFPEGF